MNLVNIDKAADMRLAGIKVSICKHNNSIRRVELTDGQGGMVVAECDYGLKFLQPEIPKPVKRYTVTGKLGVTEVKPQVFENRYEADRVANELIAQYTGDCDVKVAEIEVVVDETTGACDVPF